MKVILNYGVRETLAPGATQTTKVPVIIDRLQPIELATVVEKCIDRGLIAGLKPTAAEGIAQGIAEQIVKEFQDGHGVMFGTYFYGRLYLNGTVDSNGTLTSANGINVRLYKGNSWKLTRNDFSMKFEGDADAPKIDNVVNTDTGVRGEVVPGKQVTVNGSNLNAAGDTNRVELKADGEETRTVDAFTAAGPDILSFVCPALTAGKRYELVVYRTDVNGVTRTVSKNVTALSGEVVPQPTLTDVFTREDEPGTIVQEEAFQLIGTNLTLGEGGKVEAQRADTESPETWYELTAYASNLDAERIRLRDLAWQTLMDQMDVGTEHPQVKFRVTIGGRSAEIVATAALA